MLRESHLLSVDKALGLLEEWIRLDEVKAIERGAKPHNVRALHSTISQHRASTSQTLNQDVTVQLEKLDAAFAVFIANGAMGNPTSLQAVDHLIQFLCKDDEASVTARDWIGASHGETLRRALSVRCEPAGWSRSVVSDSSSTSNRTDVGEALLASLRWGTATFSDAKSFELNRQVREQQDFAGKWKVFEVHHGPARVFFAKALQTEDWALLGYVPEGHIKALHGSCSEAYKVQVILPALRKLTRT